MLFALSLLLICAAHYSRILRWETFINTYEKPNRSVLFRSLSIAYLFNAFLPMKLGDLLRAHFSGLKMKNGRGFALATIIIERYLDIIVVGFVFALFSLFGDNLYSRSSLYFYIIAASSVLAVTVLVYLLRPQVKKIIVRIASVFNVRIEFSLLRLCWSLICGFKDILTRIDKLRLLLDTGIMWLLYISSYYCFAGSLQQVGVNVTWQSVFYKLFAENSLYMGNLTTFSENSGNRISMLMSAGYIILPSLFLLLISLVRRGEKETVESDTKTYLNLLPHLDEQERLDFLELYFSGENREYIESYLSLNRNIEIIRDFSAGSNATTMLCRRGEESFFRKYAFDRDGEKLRLQVEWLLRYQNVLPLTEILRYEHRDNCCFYDMPYREDALNMFDYIHSMPAEKAWAVLEKLLCSLENSLYLPEKRSADIGSLDRYIREKVNGNIEKIKSAGGELEALMQYEELIINGRRYKNLNALLPYLAPEKLEGIFREDEYSAIHGDLTIENIICLRSGDFYIIDPNTGNIHESPNLDYAKLLQSLHGGYEFLMGQKELQINGSEVSFPYMRSGAYEYLYRYFDAWMSEHFPPEHIRSIYYHEIIHWLRLMPYKIEKDGRRAVLFYAGLIMVANDIIERFENNEDQACHV